MIENKQNVSKLLKKAFNEEQSFHQKYNLTQNSNPSTLKKTMKSRLIPILLTCACASLARADFNPVALTPGSYTFDIVVESNTVQALPYCINATSGSGVSLGDNTYYEQGLYARAG